MQKFSWNQWNAKALLVRRNKKGQYNNIVCNLIEAIFGSAGGFETTKRISVIWTSVILLSIRLNWKYFDYFLKYNSSRDHSWKFISNVLEMVAIASQPPWASYQICKIAGCACAVNAANVFTANDFKGKR